MKAQCFHPREYFCPRSGENECPDCGGHDTCCDHPDSHVDAAFDPFINVPPWDGVENINSYLERHDVRGEGFTY
jgi:hypothetical protein